MRPARIDLSCVTKVTLTWGYERNKKPKLGLWSNEEVILAVKNALLSLSLVHMKSQLPMHPQQVFTAQLVNHRHSEGHGSKSRCSFDIIGRFPFRKKNPEISVWISGNFSMGKSCSILICCKFRLFWGASCLKWNQNGGRVVRWALGGWSTGNVDWFWWSRGNLCFFHLYNIRRDLNRNYGFCDVIVPTYSIDELKSHFRMTTEGYILGYFVRRSGSNRNNSTGKPL